MSGFNLNSEKKKSHHALIPPKAVSNRSSGKRKSEEEEEEQQLIGYSLLFPLQSDFHFAQRSERESNRDAPGEQ